MKKIFLSPFFMPITFAVLWAAFDCVAYFGFPDKILEITKEGNLIEDFTHIGYIFLIGVLLLVANDYKDKMMTWGMYLFLAMCAMLREFGIQHHLSTTDTTPFKSRFFLNPNNPWSEKVVFGLMLIIVAASVIYLAVQYAKPLIRNFFKFDTITWSVAVLCTMGVVTKYIDRFPSNWRKAHGGVPLSENVYEIFQLVEESGEMFLPFIAMIILYQYHLLFGQK